MNDKTQQITDEGDTVEQGTSLMLMDSKLAVEMARAEIDQQISTAHAYPRSIDRAGKNLLSLVTMDETAAAECMYALPRGGKPIVGPSIRLAEAAAQTWGNNRVAARTIDVNRAEKYVEAEGVFHDLETNAATKATVRRRIVDKYGRLYTDDMIIVTGNAAQSIARRNAILAGIPKAVWRKAYEAAEGVVKGDIKTLAERRANSFKLFAAFGVKPEQIFAALGVAGEEDITLEHLPVLIGMYQALKNGESTVEQMFDPRAGGKNFSVVDNPLKEDQAAGPKKGGKAAPADDPAKPKEADEKKAATPKADAKAKPATDDAGGAGGSDAGGATGPAGGDGAGGVADDADLPAADLTPAYLAGRAARKKGMAKKAPKDMAEADAADWNEGWREQDHEIEKAGG